MMLGSPLLPYAAGTLLATAFSAAFLALPAVLGVRRLLAARWAAPLPRGVPERIAVVASCLAGALGAVGCADATSLALSSYPSEAAEGARLLLCFVAPVPLAAVPWMAGEVLSGASLRQLRSLLGAAAASCALSWLAFALFWNGTRLPLSPGMIALQLAFAAATALAAGGAYLVLRGEPAAELPAAAVALDRL